MYNIYGMYIVQQLPKCLMDYVLLCGAGLAGSSALWRQLLQR